jgi:uncharacterized protein (TIGR01777 family)
VRVVVTGSGGLVGRALVSSLRAAGHDATALVRRAPGPDERPWDPDRGILDGAALEGADAVVHLAGAGIGDRRWTPARRDLLVSSRVASTSLLARTLAGLRRPPPVLVGASAVGYYGSRGDEALTEDSGPGGGFLAELCAAWEQAARPAADCGVRVVHLRSGIVLSTDGGALARQLPLFRLGLGGRLGSGRQWISWISLPDEIDVIVHALHHESVRGPLNATAPAPVRNAQFTASLARALRRPAILAVPAPLLRLALGRDLAEEAVLASQRVLPAKLEGTRFAFRHPDLTSAFAALFDKG